MCGRSRKANKQMQRASSHPAVVPVVIRHLPMSLWTGFRLVLTGICLLGVSGCVSYPIGKQFRAQAQATKGVSFRTICENPSAYQGHMVIWGGRILTTVNETNGDYVTVLQAPLDFQERPGSTKLSQGRFVVRSPGFLDPEVYRAGAKVTIAGELSGSEIRQVGNRSYAFPVVMLRDVYFWRPEPTGPSTSIYYVAPPSLGWDWYGPGWPYDDGFHGYYNSDLDRDWGRREHERR